MVSGQETSREDVFVLEQYELHESESAGARITRHRACNVRFYFVATLGAFLLASLCVISYPVTIFRFLHVIPSRAIRTTCVARHGASNKACYFAAAVVFAFFLAAFVRLRHRPSAIELLFLVIPNCTVNAIFSGWCWLRCCLTCWLRRWFKCGRRVADAINGTLSITIAVALVGVALIALFLAP